MFNSLKAFLSSTFLFKKLYLPYDWIKNKFRYFLLCIVFPNIYNHGTKHPVDESKVLFLEVDREMLSDNFLQVYSALEKTGNFTLHSYCMCQISRSTWHQRKVFIRFLGDLATARAVFLCEGTDYLSHIPIRKETEVVQLWHGCGAFKRFGWSIGNLKFGASLDYLRQYPFHSHYSMVTVSSPEVVWAYAEAMGYSVNSGIIQPIGVSRTDVFYDEFFCAPPRSISSLRYLKQRKSV